MKFYTASIFIFVNGIMAMPWSSGRASEDITLRIQVSQSPSHHAKVSTPKGALNPESFDICWLVCWPSVPTCPDGWYSNNMGTGDEPCWTCCKAPAVGNLQL
ncbi:hypothetical protein CDV36_003278 [Fusarium kuroshium]|uniref:Uncharacterized protein n=1 Tax=Fusarium kuroshium TaxID=2010991 RepID=A0A3M2SHQ1_9HYPO|nr:hypothetical protein CDV36_003278 [Fusarium kuroshium]